MACWCCSCCFFFFFNDTATTEIYTLSLHDALPIYLCAPARLPITSCFGSKSRSATCVRTSGSRYRDRTDLAIGAFRSGWRFHLVRTSVLATTLRASRNADHRARPPSTSRSVVRCQHYLPAPCNCRPGDVAGQGRQLLSHPRPQRGSGHAGSPELSRQLRASIDRKSVV